MKYLGVLIAFVFSVQAYAGTAEFFHKRFELVREDGKVVEIRDKSLIPKFSIIPYIKYIKERLKAEQAVISQEGNYEQSIYDLFDVDQSLEGRNSKKWKTVVDSLKELEKIDFEKIFTHPKFQAVIQSFEKKLGDSLAKIGLNVVAKVDDPAFFYKRNLTYQAVRFGLDIARRQLSTIPLLNTAAFVIVQVEKMIRERRVFHQNMLLHYFENFPESELKMLKLEVDHAFSSVYESQIPWYAFWESSEAKGNWQKFGTNRFYGNIRAANNRFRDIRDSYDRVGKRVNFAFQDATQKENDVILNLFDNQAMFMNRPAVAYFYDSPQKVLRQRVVLQLAGLGLSFVPLPAFIKDLVSDFMKSMYVKQKLTEGSLVAHFESNQMFEMKRRMIVQSVNPFERDFDQEFKLFYPLP